MKNEKSRKRIQKGIAVTSIATFLFMPANMAYSANDITAGNSGIGSLTKITGGKDNITNITSDFVQNGTGINHFGNFTIGAGGTANLNGVNATRYVNMVDNMVNIGGTLNAYQTGGLPANVMFIAPNGMVVGAGGVLNVGGLQVVTPSSSAYQALIGKAGTDAASITLLESDFDNLQAGGSKTIAIGGQILSTGDVVLSAGNGIIFKDGGIIDTTGAVDGADISLFTNTGGVLDFQGTGALRINSSGDVSIVAENGSIVGSMATVSDSQVYGEQETFSPLVVNVAEGKTLNVKVADTGDNIFQGVAAVANQSTNLNVGTLEGANVKIINNGYGTLSTTKEISNVGSIYLNAENGALNVTKDINAKEIVRLNGKMGVEAEGNLNVSGNGYVSVYSANGDISTNNVTLKTGNIDINSAGGNVEFGNITITEKGDVSTLSRLEDNAKLSTGKQAPESYRTDGVHITAKNGDIIQKEDTKVTSASAVDYNADNGSITSTVSAAGKIKATAGENVDLFTEGVAHLDKITAKNVTVDGGTIYVDGVVRASNNVAITSSNKVIVRPNTFLETYGSDNYWTEGVIIAGNDVNIAAVNGIEAVNQKANQAAVQSDNGTINLMTLGDIKATDSDNGLQVAGASAVNAKGSDINLFFVDANTGNVGKIEATKNANIAAAGGLLIKEQVKAGENVAINAVGSILQADNLAVKPAIKAGGDIDLNSSNQNVGDPNNYLTVGLDGVLTATAPNGGVYIASDDALNVASVQTGKDAAFKTPSDLTIASAKIGGKLDAEAKDIVVTSPTNLTLGKVVAQNDATITANGYIHQTDKGSRPAITTGNNLTLKSDSSDVGDPNNYLTVSVGNALNATAPNGGVYIEGAGNLNVDKVQAGKDVGLKADGYLHQIADADKNDPRIISGGDMTLESAKKDVGDPNNYLQVSVGGKLDAAAPNGGVYIGSKENLTVGQIKAGKDVAIETDGYLHQTDNGQRPAITSGENMYLISNDDNVGDPNNYLTVSVGDKLNASAPNGGVYIEGYGDLTVDKIQAKDDIGIKGNKDIIIPHDKEDGNIVAGKNVKIEAGDNVINGGGEKVGIVAGGDIEIIANLNQKDPAGTIGKLPYNDLVNSINVTLGGTVAADEIGVPDANKVLNVHIMGTEVNPAQPENNDSFTMDDRDQRNMKILDGNKDKDGRYGHHRQDLRYNVASSEHIVMNSSSDSGVKVKDVLNISKQGMLVETNEVPKLGEKISITMDYKGLPFTVEGQVVRTDSARKTAGIKFNNIDNFTSSMILYLGMMNKK